MTLYDALQVSPNATAAEITRAYRSLSRRFHPDKCRHDNNSESEESLQKVREAYEVLKDDKTRLPYHRYGLIDINHAVMILTRQSQTSRRQLADPAFAELLRLVGNHQDDVDMSNDSGQRHDHNDEDHRAWLIATDLLERIRPVIEGRISEAALADAVASECDRLKRLPMGAQILRCVGRAYRYSGRKFLRRLVVASTTSTIHHHHHSSKSSPASSGLFRLEDISPSSSNVYIKVGSLGDFTDIVRDKWRDARHFMTAAVASGRVLLTEHMVAAKQQQQKQSSSESKQNAGPAISYEDWNNEQDFGEAPFSNDDHDFVLNAETTTMSSTTTVDEDRIMREREHTRAMNTLLESHQVEALWKVTKIEIDRTIRKACDLILQGQVDFFFLSQHQQQDQQYQQGHASSYYDNDSDIIGSVGDRGWVGSTGVAIDTRVARQRAAAILVMMGDIMVQRSKENTSWME
jgi:curved DNA-binding protein CbpA